MARENFNGSTRLILAQRAAYRCSSPNCRRLTIGPGLKDDQVENTGKAAHIYSASKGGPRGQGALAPALIKAPSNGIWMCSDHADLIDKNTGNRYPASVLKGWKALHEYRVAYEHTGRTSAFGFVRTLDVSESALFEPGTKITLGKTTFLIGPNESGKSALCEWLTAVDSPRLLWRWLSPTPLRFSVSFDAPIEHSLSVITGDDSLKINLDDSAVAFNHQRIEVAYIEDVHDREYDDDLKQIGDILKLDPISTKSLAALVDEKSVFLMGARFIREENDDGKKTHILRCRLADGAEMPFRALSGSEKGRVILDFAITQMRSVASFAPALLIIEWPGLNIDDAGFERYLEFFSSSDCAFQTLITLFQSKPLIEGLGWQTYKIVGRDNDQLGRINAVHPIGIT
jgi:energy-coupling factor transporter ATP-binding protein EcfA2